MEEEGWGGKGMEGQGWGGIGMEGQGWGGKGMDGGRGMKGDRERAVG